MLGKLNKRSSNRLPIEGFFSWGIFKKKTKGSKSLPPFTTGSLITQLPDPRPLRTPREKPLLRRAPAKSEYPTLAPSVWKFKANWSKPPITPGKKPVGGKRARIYQHNKMKEFTIKNRDSTNENSRDHCGIPLP